jgi:hypothetical protein
LADWPDWLIATHLAGVSRIISSVIRANFGGVLGLAVLATTVGIGKATVEHRLLQ